MNLFIFRTRQILICTDVAGMGLDIRDLNFALNLGRKSPYFAIKSSFVLKEFPKTAGSKNSRVVELGEAGPDPLTSPSISPRKVD